LKSSPSERRERPATVTMRQPKRWQRIQRGQSVALHRHRRKRW
jgi:hypothetical protein